MHIHTHFSWVSAFQTFLAVVIIGTIWRLVALHLVASKSEAMTHLGAGMLAQY